MNGRQAYLNGTITAKDAPKRLQKGTVRRITRFARPHFAMLIAFVVVTVVSAALVVVTPLLAGRVIDTIVSGGDATLVLWLAVAIAVRGMVSLALGIVSSWQSARIGE